jgi:hypothetical protein
MAMPNRKVFISLVGPETSLLFNELKRQLPKELPNRKCHFLQDPFKDYSNISILGKSKKDLWPPARTCLRWALFLQHNYEEVAPVFKMEHVDIVVVPRYGFDLVAGAIAYEDCHKSLKIHKDLVPHGVIGLGIAPPLYIFTEVFDRKVELLKKEYFAEGSGQSARTLDADQTITWKARAIVEIVKNELSVGSKKAA